MAAPSGLRKCRPDTPDEVAYERAFDEIAALADALENQCEADYATYAERLTSAIEAEADIVRTDHRHDHHAPDGATSEDYEAHRQPDTTKVCRCLSPKPRGRL
jgi:hypothetical protein